MKLKKTRRGNFHAAHSPGFRTKVQLRKQRRKEERKQKKKKRAVFATRHQTKSNSSDNNQQNANFSKKIKQLKGFAENEKRKARGELESNKAALVPVNKAGEEEEGLKFSSSVSDRLARLQEFVNKEVAGVGRANDNKKKSNDGTEREEDDKGCTIKDKQKLKSLQSSLKDDDKEINKLAKLLGYKSHQKKKVAPVFADDFGGLLDDIEEGSMASAKKYEKDDEANDSDEDLEKDMAIALGRKGEDKKRSGGDAENVGEDLMDEDFDAFESGVGGDEDEDEEDFDAFESGVGGDEDEGEEDFDAFESGVGGDEDEGEEDFDAFESGVGGDEYEGEEDYDFDDEDHFDQLNDSEASGDDYGAENYGGSDMILRESDEEEGDLDDFDGSLAPDYGREHPAEDSDANDSSLDEEEEDEREGGGLLDSQAEECSDEESDDDGELVHDFTKEYELAFEGGSSYCKPEILKNGQENDIDRYSSNSEDDEDLEGFVVDDNEVEFQYMSEELPDELSDSSPIKRRRRRFVIDDDSDEEGQDESEKLESAIASEDVDDVPLIPKSEGDISKKIRKRKQKNPKKKSDTDARKECNEQEREIEDRAINRVSDKTLRKEKRVLASSSDEDEDCGPERKRKKIGRETLSDSQDSDDSLQESTEKPVRTILKRGNSAEELHSLPRRKRKEAVSFDLPRVSEEESSADEVKEDLAGGDRKTKGGKLPTSIGKGNFLKLPDVSDDSDGDLEGTDQFDDSDGGDSLGGGEFSEDESLGSAEFSDDEEDAEGAGRDERRGTARSDEEGDEYSDGAQFSEDESGSFGSAEFSDAEEEARDTLGKETAREDSMREDIYGRCRDREGNVIRDESGDGAGNGRYIPPALRKLMALNAGEKKKEQLSRLRKTLKGLLNRLAESNVAGIASQIEGTYAKQGRNDTNEMLTSLFFESLVGPTLTPERLVQEHAMLIAVLSANVGSEVGAHILNEFVLRWNDEMQQVASGEDIDTKELDNLLLFLANLYNFRVMNARLIYDILHKLALSFTNKEVELILLVLRSVGFTLRKEDPLALKSLITKIQTQASITETKNEDDKEYSRVRFMLEVVQALRNNNVAKVPNYDPSHVEHLKKVLKGLVRKGNQSAQLNISLEDLIKARECGRWWIVGSAWSRDLPKEDPNQDQKFSVKGNTDSYIEFSEKFKERAAKLQLSRPPRINILYAVTEGSEDYLDAFEKLLQLSLPPQQERELFSVILLCCQKGKVYNPFFAHLSDRMCNFDKKYKRLLQFALWDKFKEIESLKPREASNLAKFVTHLIGENSLNLSIFKNISFMEVDSQMISFLRQILIALLLHPAGADSVERIFSELSASPKLRILRQSLRIFILKFLSAKKNKDNADHQMLCKRIQDVTEILSRGVQL